MQLYITHIDTHSIQYIRKIMDPTTKRGNMCTICETPIVIPTSKLKPHQNINKNIHKSPKIETYIQAPKSEHA